MSYGNSVGGVAMQTEPEALKEENSRLQQQVAELQQRQHEMENQMTQRTRAEAHLRECLHFVQRILDVVPDLVYVFDLGDQRVFYLNREVKEMIGYTADAIKGMGNRFLETLIHPDDMPVMEQWQQQLATASDDQIIEYENRARHANGEWRWHFSRARVFRRSERGEPLQAIITTRDTTALKEADAAIKELNDTLEQRVIERTEAMRKSQALLKGVVDNSPAAIFVKDLQGRFLLFNHHVAHLLDHDPDEMIGKTDDDAYPPDLASSFREDDHYVITRGKPIETEEVTELEDGFHEYLTVKFPIYNPEGMIYAVGGICTDITERKRAEQERASFQEQIIDAQRSALTELLTPLLPLADDVVAMPLNGIIDSARAQQIMESLLDGVSRYRATIAILDITGVNVVDTQVARAIIQTAQAVRMLGAEVVLTGIQPTMAQTLVHLGVDLSGIITRSTLQDGIAYALQTRASLHAAREPAQHRRSA